MTDASPRPAPIEFELVRHPPAPAAPPAALAGVAPSPQPGAPQPETPARPTGVGALAILGMVLGGAGAAALVFLFVMIGATSDGGALETFFGAIFLAFIVIALPFAALSFAVGYGLWNAQKWAWFGAMGLAAFQALGALAATTNEPSQSQGVSLLIAAAIPIGIIVYMMQPGVRAYFNAPRAPRAQTAPGAPALSFGTRFGIWLAGSALVAIAATLARYPMQSLLTSADGATLASDATVAMMGGALLLGGGVAALVMATRSTGTGQVVPIVAGVVGGLFLAVLLTSSANAAAIAPVVDGRASGGEMGRALVTFTAIAAIVTLGAFTLRAEAQLPIILRAGGAIGIGFGLATCAFAAFILAQAPALRASALARAHHETPAPALVLALAAIALAAWAARVSQRRG